MSADPLDGRTRVQVRRWDRDISSLGQISHALTSTTEGVDVLLQTVARTIAEVFDSSFVSIVVKSGCKQRRAIYQAGGEEESTTQTELLEHIPCLDEQTLSEQGLVEVNRLPPDHRPCQLLGDIVSVPMLRDGKPEGRICLQTGGVGGLDENDAAMLQTLANHAAVAIQNARMFEESLYIRAQTEELYRIAVQQKNEAERKQVELQVALDEIRNAILGLSSVNISEGTLTEHELEIVRLMAQGLTNKEIGQRLFLSPNTIKVHIAEIMQKLGVKRRAELVYRATEGHFI
jgi:DNA-binding CsgD family transcriptional regulator